MTQRLRTELNGKKATEIRVMIESLIEAEMTMGMDKGRPFRPYRLGLTCHGPGARGG
jgi:hypothetical protein